MIRNLFVLFVAMLATFCVLAGVTSPQAYADEGRPAGQTARATLIYGNTAYKTCYRTSCSGYNPTWTKYITHMSSTFPPTLIVDAEYKIQGGGMTGIPACRPEISDNAGWSQP